MSQWEKTTWSIDGNRLVIGGGVIEHGIDEAPWEEFKESIREVLVSQTLVLPKDLAIRHLFAGCSNLERAMISRLDTSKVQDMRFMFDGCRKLRNIDMVGCSTRGAISMSGMFRNCESLEGVNLSSFDTSNVTGMSGMFTGCTGLTRLNLTSFNTNRVANMSGMFNNCANLKHLELASFDTSNVINTSSMFAGCKRLSIVDLSSFKTSNVRNMSSMFADCSNLIALNLENFNTARVQDMSCMFMNCSNLRELDLANFNTRNASKMSGMFDGCNRLIRLVTGKLFDEHGNGFATCKMPVIYEGQPKAAASPSKTPASQTFFEILYDNNCENDQCFERRGMAGYRYVIEENTMEVPKGAVTFKGWNTARDGSGDYFMPGDEIEELPYDMTLYAIWASAPELGSVEPPEEVPYGEKIPFNVPEIDEHGDPLTVAFLEVSDSGQEGTWQRINYQAILPVSYNGYLIRMHAQNNYGTCKSQAVPIRIRKADISIARCKWVEPEDMTYDGKERSVRLVNLPEGVTAEYTGNTGVDAGDYVANATLSWDEENYNAPAEVREYKWTIHKAHYDMENVKWDYAGPFEYDGEEKTVQLTGLPEGVTPKYKTNSSSTAASYVASVAFDYDEKNYEYPGAVKPCLWEIKKAPILAEQIEWSESEGFVYDGEEKSVYITNLPEDAEVTYTGGTETEAGNYVAQALIADNYYFTSPVKHEWSIAKQTYDTSNFRWSYIRPFTYDGEQHVVSVKNVPADLEVRYYNNIGTKAGEYDAKAIFKCKDSRNYEAPAEMTRKWVINKAELDISKADWDYEPNLVYDGFEKTVQLRNLPQGVYAEYTNNRATDPGVYMASAQLIYDADNYTIDVPEDCQWQIRKRPVDISEMHWDYTEAFTYDEKEKTVQLVNIPAELSVEYKDNRQVNAGRYLATADLIPNDPVHYEKPEINGCTWTIKKAQLETGPVKWENLSGNVFDGMQKSVNLVLNDDRMGVVYESERGVSAGNYRARASFVPVDANNYIAPDPIEYSWSIEKGAYDMSGVLWDYAEPFTYDGTMKTVQLKNLPQGVIVKYEDNHAVDAGEYVATALFDVSDPNNHKVPEPMSVAWTIGKARYDMSGVKWDDKNHVYDGEPKVIKLAGLPLGVTADYFENEAVQAAEYIASARLKYDENNYEKPTVPDYSWKISKSDIDMEDVRWTYDGREPFVYDGTEKKIELKNLPEKIMADYHNNAAVNAGVYVATAKVHAENNYNSCMAEEQKWVIEKADYDMTNVYWDYNQPFTYNGETREIVLKGLPEGVIPEYTGNRTSEAGVHTADVKFSVADELNYNIPEFHPCRWEILKADPDMSQAQWVYTKPFIYSGEPQGVYLAGLPEGLIVKYSGNTATNVGGYSASVDIIPEDRNNYNKPEMPNCSWEIVKADYDMTAVRWNYNDDLIYDSQPKSVTLENLPAGVLVTYEDADGSIAGAHRAKAHLSVADPANYNVPSMPDCSWEIRKADYDMSQVEWDFREGQFVYDEREHRVALKGLPCGLSANYNENTGTNAGTYVATATFDIDAENYNMPFIGSCSWAIEKAKCDMSNVAWNYSREFTYDGDEKSVTVSGVPTVLRVEYENSSAADVGEYNAVAKFISMSDNYESPEPMECPWVIRQAPVDISGVSWNYADSFVYDGEEKRVELSGIPSGISVEYEGNVAKDAGLYVANAVLTPNSANYSVPTVRECRWEISKASYDMSAVEWNYAGPFTYDGEEKTVELAGLPLEIGVEYVNNKAAAAGTYTAMAEFVYDEANYEEPTADKCIWEIRKASYDMSATSWNYDSPFEYDGKPKQVELVGLPPGLSAEYSGNSETGAGEYTASARFIGDFDNYEVPDFGVCGWQILKKKVAPDRLRWTYEKPFVYDGSEKRVSLVTEEVAGAGFFGKLFGKEDVVKITGAPEDYYAEYENEIMLNAGAYIAKATLKHIDPANYEDIVAPECRWEILKAVPDMEGVEWDYMNDIVYDGKVKTIYLRNVPDSVKVEYEGNIGLNPGTYEAIARFTPVDPQNWEQPEIVASCMWQIKE